MREPRLGPPIRLPVARRIASTPSNVTGRSKSCSSQPCSIDLHGLPQQRLMRRLDRRDAAFRVFAHNRVGRQQALLDEQVDQGAASSGVSERWAMFRRGVFVSGSMPTSLGIEGLRRSERLALLCVPLKFAGCRIAPAEASLHRRVYRPREATEILDNLAASSDARAAVVLEQLLERKGEQRCRASLPPPLPISSNKRCVSFGSIVSCRTCRRRNAALDPSTTSIVVDRRRGM